MIKVLKPYFAAMLLALFVTAVTGCHGSKGMRAFEMPDEFDDASSYEITFWAKNDTNKAQTDIYKKAIADFESLYPNITVNLRLYTDYSRIYNDVITNITTNTTPNVCITYPDHIATYLTGTNIVVPLDSLLENGRYGLAGSDIKFGSPAKDELVAQFFNECSFNGHYYALPYMRSTEACYINKTYVEALGYTLPEALTWDFVWEVADAAMAKGDDGLFLLNGQKVMIPFIYKSTDNMMITQLKQKDAGYSTLSGDIELFNDTTAGLLATIADHTKLGAFSTFKISGYPANYLNAGQCIFAIDSTAGATWMGPEAPLLDISKDKLVDFETELMAIPQFDPLNPKMISQGPSVCIMNKENPQEVLASWIFTQYLLTNDVQIAYSRTEGYLPVTTKALHSDAYQSYLSRSGENNDDFYSIKISASKLLLDNLDNTFVTPVFNGSASVRDSAGQLIENVVKSVRRKETVDGAYIQRSFSDVRALYRLDQIGSNSLNASSSKDLGPLPNTARIFLSVLAIAWILMAVYIIANALAVKGRKVAKAKK
ncbi:MAG: extracellular solute-binding protein [Eubacteriaceae bacterium]|nr:extracellular solute-binding protein [Eubacteriaceae bacterium]